MILSFSGQFLSQQYSIAIQCESSDDAKCNVIHASEMTKF